MFHAIVELSGIIKDEFYAVADQNDRDFKAFVGAVRSGRSEAIEGV